MRRLPECVEYLPPKFNIGLSLSIVFCVLNFRRNTVSLLADLWILVKTISTWSCGELAGFGSVSIGTCIQ